MDVSDERGDFGSPPSNIYDRNTSPGNITVLNIHDDLLSDSSDDMDWAGMLGPVQNKKIIVTHKAHPYSVSRSVCHGVESNDDDSYRDTDEYQPPTCIDELIDIEILKSASLVARSLKYRVTKKMSDDQKSALNWIIQSAGWLLDSMQIMTTRLSQIIDVDEDLDKNREVKKSDDTIGRNSYKFCEFGHNCTFNYSSSQSASKRDCYSQHYVYPLVKSDIENLIDHIASRITNNESVIIKEIVTSINTITYVINHMYNELNELIKTDEKTYKRYDKRSIELKCITKNSKKRHRKIR